jgi:hypothetical protein
MGYKIKKIKEKNTGNISSLPIAIELKTPIY